MTSQSSVTRFVKASKKNSMFVTQAQGTGLKSLLTATVVQGETVPYKRHDMIFRPYSISASGVALENQTLVGGIQFKSNQDRPKFSVEPGSDSDKFRITETGDLHFKEAPDFENPQSSLGTNTYQVTIKVTDIFKSSLIPITVTVTDEGSEVFTGEASYVALNSVNRIRHIRVDPATGNVFVVREDYAAVVGTFTDADYVTIIKFDSDLNYVKHTTIDRSTREGTMQSLYLANDSLYLTGLYKDYSSTQFNTVIMRFDLDLNLLTSLGLTGNTDVAQRTATYAIGGIRGSSNVLFAQVHVDVIGSMVWDPSLMNSAASSLGASSNLPIASSLLSNTAIEGHVNNTGVYAGVCRPGGVYAVPTVHARVTGYTATDVRQVNVQLAYPSGSDDTYPRALLRNGSDYYLVSEVVNQSYSYITKFTFSNLGTSDGIVHVKSIKVLSHRFQNAVLTSNGLFAIALNGTLFKFDFNLNFIGGVDFNPLGTTTALTTQGDDIYWVGSHNTVCGVILKFQDITDFDDKHVIKFQVPYETPVTILIDINHDVPLTITGAGSTPTITTLTKTSHANTKRSAGLTVGNRNSEISVLTALNTK